MILFTGLKIRDWNMGFDIGRLAGRKPGLIGSLVDNLKVLRKDRNAYKRRGFGIDWWFFRLPGLLARGLYRPLDANDGIYVMEEDWDNLIILDACRYDLFKEVMDGNAWLEGFLEKKISRGSYTNMFLKENFKGRRYEDTVYVSANPLAYGFKEAYNLVYVQRDEKDERAKTVLPETVLECALEANEANPKKRLVVHFMQPHYPYVGTGKKMVNPFLSLSKGEVTKEEVWSAYKKNLERVMPVVRKLVEELEGKSVVTADHGEAFGEWATPLPIRIWGHNGPRIKSLVDVPWFIVDKKGRKRISEGTMSRETGDASELEMKRRLEDLGYF